MLTPETYHADRTRDSSSTLRLFENSVERYAAERIFQTLEPDEPTAAMQQGNDADLYALDPEKFSATVLIAPPEVTRRHKAFETLETANPGRRIITPAEMKVLVGIRDGMARNDSARRILEADGDVQKIITWKDADTGAPLKLMEDKILRCGIMANMKVTDNVDPESWAKKVANFNYHCQAALYLDGAWQGSQFDGTLVWIVVSREPPHECVCYEPDEDMLKVGRRRNAETLKELCDRRTRSDWRGRWTDSIHKLSLPPWAAAKVKHE